MQRFLVKVVLWLSLVLAFVLGYGIFCDFFFLQKKYLDLSEKKQWVFSLEGGEYDYAVLGSSRAYGAFDMNLLDSLTGWNGINIGSNGSGFKDNYLVLTLFLKSNNIKRLFLQVDMASLNSKASFSNEFHAFAFIPYWEEAEVREVLKAEIPQLDNPISATFPQWRYFYFNKYFSPKEVIRRGVIQGQQVDPFISYKGGIGSNWSNETNEKIQIHSLPKTVDPEDREYFIKTMMKAEAAGIEVVFFSTPRYIDKQDDVKYFLSSFPNLAMFPDRFSFTDPDLFLDQGHLNDSGRFKFTMIFFEMIVNKILKRN